MSLSNQSGTARRFFEREREDVGFVMAKTRINFHPVIVSGDRAFVFSFILVIAIFQDNPERIQSKSNNNLTLSPMKLFR